MSDHVLYALNDKARIRFHRQADRFRHVIEIQKNDEWFAALSSVEGGPEDDWPPSPPIQELNSQKLENDRYCLLGVGQAGTSHWSLSVETTLEDALQVDVACRISQLPSALHSTYILNADAIELPGSVCVGDVQISIQTISACDLELIRREHEQVLQFSAANLAQRAPHTARWKYRIGS